MLKDEQILYDALKRYAGQRRAFIAAINDPNYRTPEGKKPSAMEKQDAERMADRCDLLVEAAREKMDSPIIVLN